VYDFKEKDCAGRVTGHVYIDIFAMSVFVGAFEEATGPPRSQGQSRDGDATAGPIQGRGQGLLSKIIGGAYPLCLDGERSEQDGIKRSKKRDRRANYRESIEPLIAEGASERASESLTFASGEEFRSFVRSGPHPLCLRR